MYGVRMRAGMPPTSHAEKRKKGRCAGCADGGQQASDRVRGEVPRLLEAVGVSDFSAEIAGRRLLFGA